VPVVVNSKQHIRSGSDSFPPVRHTSPTRRREHLGGSITIGLINNMPQAAFAATERQFISVLERASDGVEVHLSLYSLLDLPGSRYQNIDQLWETDLDGLIVTGKEPLTENLSEEPCWKSLTEVLEWARENTYSTVCSCLAAHAAVLYMDGIGRRKNDEKHFGVFECESVSRHPLTAGIPATFQLPHSRWNSLPEEELATRGYSVLTRIAGLGVDTFIKEENSLFVFFQGHPEYDSRTLLREYRRDVARYINHEANNYPSIPVGYFDRDTQRTLTALREKAMSSRDQETLASVWTALEETEVNDTWRATTECIYRNWLEQIYARKTGRHVGDADVA
jgi:homoserine O-succinyltransferase/O-acetyltransferase